MAFIVKNVTAKVQSALASADAITGISQASEAVITCSNAYTAGQYVVIKAVQGMIEINHMPVRVKSPTGTEFTAEGLDSTNFTAYQSGGTSQLVSSTETLGEISSVDFANLIAAKQDVTSISSKTKQEINGLKDAPKASFSMFSDPLDPAIVELRKASDADEDRVFEFIFNNEGFTVFMNGEVSGGDGLSASAGAPATSPVELTLKHVQRYVAT